MSQQLINIGNVANDGTGVRLRDAFRIINENFTDLYTTGITNYANVVSFPDATQNIGVTAYSVAEDLMYFSNGASWQPLLTNDSNIVLFGNLVAGNIDATGLVNITGNISATLGTFSNATVTSNATFGNINSVSGMISVTGNANVGNLNSIADVRVGGNLYVTGNTVSLTSANTSNIWIEMATGAGSSLDADGGGIRVLGAGANITYLDSNLSWNLNKPLVVTGNITGSANALITGNGTFGNINSVSGILTVAGNVTAQADLAVTSNVTAGNINSVTGIVSVTGNLTAGNLLTAGLLSATGNLIGGNLSTAGRLDVTGNASVGNLAVTGKGVFVDGSASEPSITHSGDLNTGVWFPAADSIAVSTGGSQRFTIDSTGDVIIGNSQSINGLRNLDIYNTDATTLGSGSIIRLITAHSSNVGLGIVDMVRYKSGAFVISNSDNTTNAVILFSNAGSERMRIDPNGNVGIGNASPTHTLSVTGTMNVSGNANVGNIGAGAGVFTGNVSAGNISVASGTVAIGAASATANTVLTLTSTTGALLLPRMTTTQRDAMTAANGMVIYNTTVSKFQGYGAGAWGNIALT